MNNELQLMGNATAAVMAYKIQYIQLENSETNNQIGRYVEKRLIIVENDYLHHSRKTDRKVSENIATLKRSDKKSRYLSLNFVMKLSPILYLALDEMVDRHSETFQKRLGDRNAKLEKFTEKSKRRNNVGQCKPLHEKFEKIHKDQHEIDRKYANLEKKYAEPSKNTPELQPEINRLNADIGDLNKKIHDLTKPTETTPVATTTSPVAPVSVASDEDVTPQQSDSDPIVEKKVTFIPKFDIEEIEEIYEKSSEDDSDLSDPYGFFKSQNIANVSTERVDVSSIKVELSDDNDDNDIEISSFMPSNEVPGTSASVSHGQKRKDNSDHQNESNYGKRLREQSPFYANNTKQTRTPTRDLQKNDESNTAHMTNEQVKVTVLDKKRGSFQNRSCEASPQRTHNIQVKKCDKEQSASNSPQAKRTFVEPKRPEMKMETENVPPMAGQSISKTTRKNDGNEGLMFDAKMVPPMEPRKLQHDRERRPLESRLPVDYSRSRLDFQQRQPNVNTKPAKPKRSHDESTSRMFDPRQVMEKQEESNTRDECQSNDSDSDRDMSLMGDMSFRDKSFNSSYMENVGHLSDDNSLFNFSFVSMDKNPLQKSDQVNMVPPNEAKGAQYDRNRRHFDSRDRPVSPRRQHNVNTSMAAPSTSRVDNQPSNIRSNQQSETKSGTSGKSDPENSFSEFANDGLSVFEFSGGNNLPDFDIEEDGNQGEFANFVFN